MIAGKDKITPGQLMFVIIQAQIGVNILFLPSSVESVASSDAWISVSLAGITTMILILAIWGLSRRFPGMILFDYLPLLLGKPIGTIVHLVFAASFIAECSLTSLLFVNAVRDWIFPNTPKSIVLILILAVSLYMARENLRAIARFFVLTFGLIFLMIFIATYAYKEADIMYILPINQAGIPSIIKGALFSMNSFFGYEMLFFCYPYVQGKSRTILKAVFYANTFSVLVYVYLVFTCLLVFTPEEIKIIPQPILYMVKALSFTIIERADLYFLTIWTVVVTSTIMAYLFMSARSVSSLFGMKNHAGTTPFVTLIVFCISLYPHNQDMVNRLKSIVGILGSVSFVTLPIVLLCISYLFKVQRKESAEG
ncbi:GerAB/ArcD/ProY family transporter [Cohnella terricola]|uniref:GerAB/ArcD/ProY family transporter n=1 Tax=Cohnella terricola TaxID=1289167 RepID=A0A559JIK8_9BACL|nr:GerAB/ArcD/ProY family transporter [Cohnella terricola]TVX99708.1 GerAB/ArcD/ProY family transporter [Cohnella terricola]